MKYKTKISEYFWLLYFPRILTKTEVINRILEHTTVDDFSNDQKVENFNCDYCWKLTIVVYGGGVG